MHLTREGNLSTLGAAICAAHALGLYPDLAAASRRLAAEGERIEPDPARARWYAATLGQYHELTETLAPALHRLSGAEEETA